MTIYNFLADIIPHMAVTQGVQSVFDVNMGMPSVMGWYHVGEDVQPAQELTLHERGKGLVLVAVKCNQYAKDRRADMLRGVPASEVAPMFRQRAAQMLGTEDVAYIQDLGELEHGKVGLVAVPSVAFGKLCEQEQEAVIEMEHEAEPSVDPAQEPAVEAPVAMEPRRNEEFSTETEKPSIIEPEPPSDRDDDTPEPPTPSNPSNLSNSSNSSSTAAPSDEPSLFDDSDFEAFIAEDRKRNAPGWVDRFVMYLAVHGHDSQYYWERSLWSGKVEKQCDPSTIMKFYLLGISILALLTYYPCIKWGEYMIYSYPSANLTWAFLPEIIACAIWSIFMLYINYRVKATKNAMA